MTTYGENEVVVSGSYEIDLQNILISGLIISHTKPDYVILRGRSGLKVPPEICTMNSKVHFNVVFLNFY